MRLLTGIFLTGLVLLNLSGFYIAFVFEQADIRQEMAANITHTSNEHRQTLKFDNKDFSKLLFNDDGKELALDGKLYDVVSIEHVGNLVKIIVEYDSTETNLVGIFDSVFSGQQNNSRNSSPVKNIISHFQQNYVVSHQVFKVASINNAAIHQLVNPSHPLSCFVAFKLAPPPKLFLV